MVNESALVFAGVAPHPPIMVPEIGGEAIASVRRSIRAMAELTERILNTQAQTLVLISPHAPLEPDEFVAYNSAVLHGDFQHFRAATTTVEAELDPELLDIITKFASQDGLRVRHIDSSNLDHGTSVPLYFLQRNGWAGKVVAFGYSYLSNSAHLQFGKCLRKAADALERRVALIASGDLSHRLKMDAPAGYHPHAYVFDEEVVDAIKKNAFERIIKIDPALRKLAGECGYRSMLVAFGAAEDLDRDGEVLNYEAPFGVGYMVAQILNKKGTRVPPSIEISGDIKSDLDKFLPQLARDVIESYVLTGNFKSPQKESHPILSERVACFVSLKTASGELRGCIGTIEPMEDCFADELAMNAVGAASRDPRFSPVTAEELGGLRYSVDILSPPEPATLADLDPLEYGVVVEDESGMHRGLLLPDIEGVKSAEQQVEIAARKAGIPAKVPLRISRFRVDRFPKKVRS